MPAETLPQDFIPEVAQAAGRLLTAQENTTGPAEHQLSPEAISAIEQMDAPFTTKTEFLLTASGVKPASISSIQTPGYLDTPKGEMPPTMPEEIVQEHLRVAREAGLSVIVSSTHTVGRKGELQATALTLFVGSSLENVERLRDAVSSNDTYAVGRALGHPETAVDAFVNHPQDTIPVGQLPNIPPEVADYADFVLSKDHYAEELKTVELWERTVRELSPTIYNERPSQKARLAARHDVSSPHDVQEERADNDIQRFSPLDIMLPETLAVLENSRLPSLDKMDILLTALGLKPTSFTVNVAYDGIPNGDTSGQARPDLDEYYKDYVTAARKMGLFVHVKTTLNDPRLRAGLTQMITTGESEEDVTRLDQALAQKDDLAIGTLLGYPRTAVEAFAKGIRGVQRTNFTDDPAVLAFARFSPSPENGNEELDVVREWLIAAKKVSPTIYQEVIDNSPFKK